MFYCGIVHDLTARKEAERVLARSQRMEAVGQLTGGIAHDFNNLLTVITGNLELLEMQLESQPQLELLSEAQAAADLGASLTNHLLAFARRSVLQPEVVHINRLIGGISSMLKRTLGGHIEFGTSMFHQLWSTRVDPAQVGDGAFEPCGQCARCDAVRRTADGGDAQHLHRRPVCGPGSGPGGGRLCAHLGVGHRQGDARRGAAAGCSNLFHDQAGVARHGTRTVDGLRLRQAVRAAM